MNKAEQFEAIEKLLPTKLYEGSKDWAQGDVIARVEWLLTMYENVKTDRDQMLAQLEAQANK